MKFIPFIFFYILYISAYSQMKDTFTNDIVLDKHYYLQENRYDLYDPDFHFPNDSFNIVGFGAYHGSSKTEEAEYSLMKSLAESGRISYYVAETDFATAYYFNKFLESGDTVLLKELVKVYSIRVPQDGSIATYEKWKKLKSLNDGLSSENKFSVIGIDLIASYKFSIQFILEQLNHKIKSWDSLQELDELFRQDTSYYHCIYESYTIDVLKSFLKEYESKYTQLNLSTFRENLLSHVINTLKVSFSKAEREKEMFLNYVTLKDLYQLEKRPQFVRLGFFHLEKQREGNYPSFFTRLIEENIYDRENILTIMGYLTNSQVLWNRLYEQKWSEIEYMEDLTYQSYNTKKGFGIGDYWKEYFRGIKYLKANKLSDLTLFRLNKSNSPYHANIPDLIEVKKIFNRSNKDLVNGKSTLQFIDYAVLISHSEANIPIEELK